MTVDRERIDQKAAYIREQTAAVRRLTSERPKAELLADPWLVKGLKYALQTSIEAVIDIAYHVSAKGLSHAPVDARDALSKLAEAGILTADEVPKYQSMVGFRNRLVHGYRQVTDERVYQVSTAELDDFEAFLKRIYAALEKGLLH